MSKWSRYALAGILLVAIASTACATEIWYEDNNLGGSQEVPADFMEKFQHPGSFKEATSYIRVYMVRAKWLDSVSDDFLINVFKDYLKRNDIKLAIDAGGATFAQLANRRNITNSELALYKHLKQLGITVDYISLQSVLSKSPKVDGEEINYPMDKRIEDVVAYAKSVRETYPQVQIGIIDASPSQGKPFRKPYRLLKDAMDNAGTPLAFIHLDVAFDIPREHRKGVSWRSLTELENYVENDLGLKFGIFTTSRKGGMTSSKDFNDRVIAALDCYTEAGGTPSSFIIASWYPYPETTIPENATGDDYPAMRTVKEFGRELKTIESHGEMRNFRFDRHSMCEAN